MMNKKARGFMYVIISVNDVFAALMRPELAQQLSE